MKILRFICLLAAISSSFATDQTENVRSYIKDHDFVVDICVYEQEWLSNDPVLPKLYGILTERAVVTATYKGNIKIGTKLEFQSWVENPPTLFKHFRSVVEGELWTFFFSKDSSTFKDGKFTIKGDSHWRIPRFDDDFSKAFQKELKSNPQLKATSEQGAAANP